MKLIALASLLALAAAPVRFEAEGVRIGDTLVQGTVLELKGTETGALLASGSSVEPLTAALEIQVAEGRMLVLEPGLRATRADGGLTLASPAGRSIRFEAGDREIELASPAKVGVSDKGWTIGAETLEAASLRAVLKQDDADKNLQKMRQQSQRSRQVAPRKGPSRQGGGGGMRRVFVGGDPIVSSEATDPQTLRVVGQLTPGGF